MLNSAGIFGPSAPASDCPDDILQRELEVNLWAVYFGMKHAIPRLRESARTRSSTGPLAPYQITVRCVKARRSTRDDARRRLELAKDEIRVIGLGPIPPMVKEGIKNWSVNASEEVQAVMETITPMGRPGRPEEKVQVAGWSLLEAPA